MEFCCGGSRVRRHWNGMGGDRMNAVRPGIYPTMITPYDREGQVDMEAVRRVV